MKRPALILLNDDDLAYAKIRLDAESLATAKAHLKDFKESLPRTLVSASAWDATRDGETPAREYVDFVLATIGHESDSTVIMVLLRQLATALALLRCPRAPKGHRRCRRRFPVGAGPGRSCRIRRPAAVRQGLRRPRPIR